MAFKCRTMASISRSIAVMLLIIMGVILAGPGVHAESLNTGATDPCKDVTNSSSPTVGGGGPVINVRDDMQAKDEAAVKSAGEDAALSIDVPKHVKEVVTCLKDLMNVGATVGITFGWPSLDAIFTTLINQACAMLQSYMDQLLNQLIANIQLPSVMTDIMGIAMPGFTGSLTGQFVRGVPAGTVTINAATPNGSCNSVYDPKTSIMKTTCYDPKTGVTTVTEYDTVTGKSKTYTL